MTTGTLEVHIVEAVLERNVDTFTKQDPYAVFEIIESKYRTKTVNNGGKTPKWDEKMILKVLDTADDMNVQIWDEDTMEDDLICEGKIALA